MTQKTDLLEPILDNQPIIPVLTISTLSNAVPLARALVRGGLPAIEVTLRTSEALDAIRLISAEVEGAIVGAGTILNTRHFDDAVSAGARFVVSPGTTQELLDAATASETPFLPGATTPSEIMAMHEEGYSILKFFPAEQAGGVPYLKSIAAPLSGIRFCPTGGISATNAASYLKLPNVICVGGSWVAPGALAADGDWNAIEKLARQATVLKTN